jgi:hypothetical protein
MNPPPVPQRVLALSLLIWGLGACQGKSEPDPPRTPRPVIEARSFGSSVARIVAGHPCRAEVEGEELLIGTEPLVAQVGNSRWSGITNSAGSDAGTTLSRDGQAMVRIRDVAGPEHGDGIDVFDPRGSVILHVSGDGAIANGRGEVVRRAQAERAAVKIGDSVVVGTTDVALAVLITAPELVPEVRGLAACQRLFAKEQAARN